MIITEWLNQSLTWVKTHQETALAVAITTLGGGGLLVYFAVHTKTLEQQAWTDVLNAQGLAAQGKAPEALNQLDQVSQRFGRLKASSHAQLLKAEILVRQKKWGEAAAIYERLAAQTQVKEIRPFALLGLANSQIAQANYAGASASYQRLLSDFPDHFLSPKAYQNLAAIQEMTGQLDQARQTYQRLQTLYPNSPWAALAGARLIQISPHK